jgi:hypothetical protein
MRRLYRTLTWPSDYLVESLACLPGEARGVGVVEKVAVG